MNLGRTLHKLHYTWSLFRPHGKWNNFGLAFWQNYVILLRNNGITHWRTTLLEGNQFVKSVKISIDTSFP